MTILIIDESWTSLLCAVYEIYSRKLLQVIVTRERYFQPEAFSTAVEVYADELNARRVWKGLEEYISPRGMNQLYACYLSGLEGIENSICQFIRMTFDSKKSPEYAFADPSVLRISKVDKMVHREKHRMEAFIRFQLTKDDLYYATIEPDFNVIPLIAKHFKRRYADQRWLIYDLKRKYGIYSDMASVSEVILNETAGSEKSEIFCDDEILYQDLWRDYFKHVNIKERKNKKLHLQHVPVRYWKHLTEKA